MADYQGQGIQNLIGDALRESSDLARKELALFKAELAANVKTILTGVAMMAAAGIFAIAALILFTGALVEWLATVVDSEALSSLIVGAVMAAIAVGLVLYGRSTMSSASLAPNRAITSIQRDKQVLTEKVAG
jgi:hypothetical protein